MFNLSKLLGFGAREILRSNRPPSGTRRPSQPSGTKGTKRPTRKLPLSSSPRQSSAGPRKLTKAQIDFNNLVMPTKEEFNRGLSVKEIEEENGNSTFLDPLSRTIKSQGERFRARARTLRLDPKSIIRAMKIMSDEANLWQRSESPILRAIPKQLKALRQMMRNIRASDDRQEKEARDAALGVLNNIFSQVDESPEARKELIKKINQVIRNLPILTPMETRMETRPKTSTMRPESANILTSARQDKTKFLECVEKLGIFGINKSSSPTLEDVKNFLVATSLLILDLGARGKLSEQDVRALYIIAKPITSLVFDLSKHEQGLETLGDNKVSFKEATSRLENNPDIVKLVKFASGYGITARTSDADIMKIVDEAHTKAFTNRSNQNPFYR